MRHGLFGYIWAAFNARPLAMPVAPNWVGIAACGLLGLVNPAFWFIGAGVELAYLLLLGTNARFQRLVDAKARASAGPSAQERLDLALKRLPAADAQRFLALQRRCQAALADTPAEQREVIEAQAQAFGRLAWLYVQLLSARAAIRRVVNLQETGDANARMVEDPAQPPHLAHLSKGSLARQREELRRQLEQPNLSDDLRRSLTAQDEILAQRLAMHAEAKQSIGYIDAELARVEQQVSLVREQALLSAQPGGLSGSIDSVDDHLSQTTGWLREQQRVYAELGDVLGETGEGVVFQR